MSEELAQASPRLTKAGHVAEKLALQHGVTYVRSCGDEFAESIARLAGDDPCTDSTENLLLALKRHGIIDNDVLVTMLGEHLEEKFKDFDSAGIP